MKIKYTLSIVIFFVTLNLSLGALAHSSSDPSSELHKLDEKINQLQLDFKHALTDEERMNVAEKQFSLTQRKILLLRNMMVSDFPHIKSSMSKYQHDYIKETEETLKQAMSILKQFKKTLR